MPKSSSKITGVFPAEQSGAPDLLLRLSALAFSAVWLGAAGLYTVEGWQAEGSLRLALSGLAAGLPVLLAWVLVGTIVSIRRLRAQTAALQKTIDGLRAAQSRQTVLRKNAPAPALLPPPAAGAESQPGLALDPATLAPSAPLAMADLLRALHFPDGPEDKEGFRALRLALADHTTAKLIRSAQDVLTLMAQDGIFMDALEYERPRPRLWRKFATGERGEAIAELGGVRDRSCLALTANRMRNDIVFRDAAHHFLRSFDKLADSLVPGTSDSDLTALSETRTARAFMLLGRVTGTFD